VGTSGTLKASHEGDAGQPEAVLTLSPDFKERAFEHIPLKRRQQVTGHVLTALKSRPDLDIAQAMKVLADAISHNPHEPWEAKNLIPVMTAGVALEKAFQNLTPEKKAEAEQHLRGLLRAKPHQMSDLAVEELVAKTIIESDPKPPAEIDETLWKKCFAAVWRQDTFEAAMEKYQAQEKADRERSANGNSVPETALTLSPEFEERAFEHIPLERRQQVKGDVLSALESRPDLDVAQAMKFLADAISENPQGAWAERNLIPAITADAAMAQVLEALPPAKQKLAQTNVESAVERWGGLFNTTTRELMANLVIKEPSTAYDARVLDSKLWEKKGISNEEDAQKSLNAAISKAAQKAGTTRQTAEQNVEDALKLRGPVGVKEAKAFLAAALSMAPSGPANQKEYLTGRMREFAGV